MSLRTCCTVTHCARGSTDDCLISIKGVLGEIDAEMAAMRVNATRKVIFAQTPT